MILAPPWPPEANLLRPFMLPNALRHLPDNRRILVADDGVPGLAALVRAELPEADIVAHPAADPDGEPYGAIVASIPAPDPRRLAEAVAAALPLLSPSGTFLVPMDMDVFRAASGLLNRGDLAVRPFWLTGGPGGLHGLVLASIARRRSNAFLFAGLSFSGKSVAAADLGRRSGLPVTHGDLLLYEIGFGRVPAPERLTAICREACRRWDMGWAISEIFARGVAADLLDLVPACAAGDDFIFEMWMPDRGGEVAALLDERGFKVWLLFSP